MCTQPAIRTLQIAAGDYEEMVWSADKVISTSVNNSVLVPPKSAADYIILDRTRFQLNRSFRLWARLRIKRGRCSLDINLGSVLGSVRGKQKVSETRLQAYLCIRQRAVNSQQKPCLEGETFRRANVKSQMLLK